MLRRTRRHPALLLLVLAAGCHRDTAPQRFPGTIEVDESDAAPLLGGRIVALRVEEGDTVRIGDTLAILTQSQAPAAVEERRARLAAAEARLADLRRGARSAELDRARADLAAAAAEADRAAKDLERGTSLAQTWVIAKQELDRLKATAETAARRRDAATAALALAEEGSRTDQVRAAEAEVRSAAAQLSGARADLGELAVLAAVDGVVLGKHAEPGEVVASGTPLVTIGVVSHRWVRVYLPADLVDRLPAGAAATVTIAESPSRRAAEPPTHGRLASVSSRAEFTPRSALTEEERADLLFAARVDLVDPPATLRPGLPVTVTFPPAAP